MELERFVRVYDHALSATTCEKLISTFNGSVRHQRQNGAVETPSLSASNWRELDLTAHADIATKALFLKQAQEYRARYVGEVGLTLPISPVRRLSELVLKRYRKGANERFQVHYDSLGPVSNRYLVFLWYLNDVDSGGETEFVDIGVKISARRGRLVVFPPYWMFQHAGLPPESNDKFILSTYLIY